MQNTLEKERDSDVPGLKTEALHVSALSMESWKATCTPVPEPRAEGKLA